MYLRRSEPPPTFCDWRERIGIQAARYSRRILCLASVCCSADHTGGRLSLTEKPLRRVDVFGHPIPGSFVQHATGRFFIHAAPLLEEKWNVMCNASVADS